MKKIIIAVLVLFVFSTLIISFSESVEASTSNLTATTTADLNVREKPNVNAKKIGLIKKGTKIVVHEKLNSGWSKITYNKKTAYVNTKYLTFSSTVTSSWNGTYGFSNKYNNYRATGKLIIKNHKSNKFFFELEVSNYHNTQGNGYSGNVDGKATVKGNVASVNIKEDGFTCKLTLKKTTKGIVVEEVFSNNNRGCQDFHGVGIMFNGTYKKQ